ncbi:MAG: EamA family transporter [Erysipelotrichaceae bacterium]|nr:EamA family transporter [Erysipelotrichaceae bacterium]
MLKILSFLLIVAASAMYQVASEKTAPDVNPFAGIIVIYLTALLTSLVVYLITSKGVPLFTEMKKVNVFSIIIGVVVCLVDLGYIMAYRSGFSIGKLSPLSSVTLIIVMALIAVIFYKERLNPRHILGLIIAAIGILLTIEK